jgi:hypothetical protein
MCIESTIRHGGILPVVLTIGALIVSASQAAEPEYPPVSPPADTSAFGENIQRTMHLLASSTAEKPNTVRIQFYGQSVTKQDWWKLVVADLRNRFPHANIIAQNPSIGGFASQRLIWTTPMDVGGFYPDLVIFHVFGGHGPYEDIIRWIRVNTTAEIAMATDHLHARTDPKQADDGWLAFMNQRFLPAVAEAYDCQLTDVRTPWRGYLLEHDLPSQAPLRDGVHLNDHGCWLMAQLVGRTLQVRQGETPPAESWVRTRQVGKDVMVKEGKITLEFTGNRVVALSAAAESPAVMDVRVDGKKPSELRRPYRFTRANAGPGEDWPWTVGAPVKITSDAQLQPETWTITVTEGGPEAFEFKLEGSKTGPDGAGSTEEKFVSDSGRVVIEPEHWWKSTPKGKVSPVKPGYKLVFESELMGTDVYEPPAKVEGGALAETVLVSGLDNGKHRLELTIRPGGELSLEALGIHEPPLKPASQPRRVDQVVSPHGEGDADDLPDSFLKPM